MLNLDEKNSLLSLILAQMQVHNVSKLMHN
jgi:hypothetical protein